MDLLKILLIGGGAYLLWQAYSNAQLPATTPGTTPPATPPTTPPSAINPAIQTLASALNDKAMKDGIAPGATIANGKVNYNVWQWNFVMQELNSNAQTLETSDNSRVMTSAQYAAERASANIGLSGLRRRYA